MGGLSESALGIEVQVWLLRLAFLAVPALLWLSRGAIRTWLRDVPRWTWVALGAVVVTGGVLRAVGSLWNVNHENAIGWIIFQDAVALDHVPSYGLGGHVLYHAALSVLPTAPATLFALNFVLATLTPALLFLVAWGVLRAAPAVRGAAALVSAGLLALNPAHIRLSASESLHVPLLFFGALGLAALLCALSWGPDEPAGAREGGVEGEAARTRWWTGHAPLLLAATVLALAVQIRPLGALLAVPAGLIFAFRAPRPVAWLRSGRLWGAAALALALASLHVLWLLGRVTADDGALGFFRVAPADILPRLLEPAQHAFVDPAVTPLVLQVLVALGVVALAICDRRALGVLLPTWLVMTWFHTTHGENPVDHLRFSMGPLPWAALLGGAALLPLGRLRVRAAGKIVGGVTAAVLLLAGAGLYARRDVPTARYDTQRELPFWRQALPRLPERGVLVRLDRFTAGRVLTTALPVAWFRAEGHALVPVDASALLGEPDAVFRGDAPVLWYRGITCWAFDHGEARAGGLRPLCRAVEERFRATPIAETSFPARPDRFTVGADTITIGFYRLER